MMAGPTFETVPRKGYRFQAEVFEEEDVEATRARCLIRNGR